MLLEAALLAGAMNEAISPEYVELADAGKRAKTTYVAGMCQIMNQRVLSLETDWKNNNRMIGIEHAAMHYSQNQLKRDVDCLPLARAVTVEVSPKHGILDIGYAGSMSQQHGDQPVWRYFPEPGFIGTDWATFLVDVQGTLVRVVAKIVVTDLHENDPKSWKLCAPLEWVISGLDASVHGFDRAKSISQFLAATGGDISFSSLPSTG
ncbi:MAG: hypothetical protein LBI87_09405 [Candidatus Accumulibacter sp.]|nr:hypothetical protein [Accumulibacter sp.]